MKKLLCILLLLFCIIGINSQTILTLGRVKVDGLNIARSGENLLVSMNIDVAGIESPGLTSAPAIGEYVARIVNNIYPAERKTDFIDSRKGIPSMALATEEEREALIRENPAFANVICRCELVTEGEILEAIHRPVGATTLDGVKRRTRAGMGRCQAGFCSPKTLEILSRELQITKEGTGSEILTGKNKDTAPGEGGTWKRTQAPVGKEALHE